MPSTTDLYLKKLIFAFRATIISVCHFTAISVWLLPYRATKYFRQTGTWQIVAAPILPNVLKTLAPDMGKKRGGEVKP